MPKTVEGVAVTAPGLSDQDRARLEDFLLDQARHWIARADEEAEMDRQTETGIAEFERGDFITIEEFRERMEAHKLDLQRKYGG